MSKQLRKQSQENASSEGKLASLTAKLEKLEQREAQQSGIGVRMPWQRKTSCCRRKYRSSRVWSRDRTEQLNQARWRQQMAEQQQSGDDTSEKMMVVLNQQLTAAQERQSAADGADSRSGSAVAWLPPGMI